ncbi:DUF371 domain-containing protein [Candidatus Woesearchaeota archaeon]|nr:DUF371 domain-containing protein [Candidatus Woesearchaeota archaeon]
MYKFTISGHKNITSKHRNTIEFTKDDFVTKKGDCILGISAGFDIKKLKEITKKNKKIKIILTIDNLKDEINAYSNPDFNDENELVIRKSDFNSKRTLAVKSDKAAVDIDREIVEKLKNQGQKAIVIIK